jgi:hypothetical protein
VTQAVSKKWKGDHIKELAKAGTTCLALVHQRTGFMLDFAFAYAHEFQNVEGDIGHPLASAAWLTAAYLADNWSFIGMVRGRADRNASTWSGSIDSGARVVYAGGRFGIGIEALLRVGSDGKLTHRVALIGDYEITDGVWLSVSGGNGFSGNNPDTTGWFTSGNFKFTGDPQRAIDWIKFLSGKGLL